MPLKLDVNSVLLAPSLMITPVVNFAHLESFPLLQDQLLVNHVDVVNKQTLLELIVNYVMKESSLMQMEYVNDVLPIKYHQ